MRTLLNLNYELVPVDSIDIYFWTTYEYENVWWSKSQASCLVYPTVEYLHCIFNLFCYNFIYLLNVQFEYTCFWWLLTWSTNFSGKDLEQLFIFIYFSKVHRHTTVRIIWFLVRGIFGTFLDLWKTGSQEIYVHADDLGLQYYFNRSF